MMILLLYHIAKRNLFQILVQQPPSVITSFPKYYLKLKEKIRFMLLLVKVTRMQMKNNFMELY